MEDQLKMVGGARAEAERRLGNFQLEETVVWTMVAVELERNGYL